MRTDVFRAGFGMVLIVLALNPLHAAYAAQQLVGFGQADANGDGYIDYEEFRSHMVDTFYRADVNRDGKLSGGELRVLNPQRIPAADHNGDGRLSLKEFLNATGADFRAVDRNRDNVLSPDEIKAANP